MKLYSFYDIATNLEDAGLVWAPEIGDEISKRGNPQFISVLVDPHSMSPNELRSVYLWLPSVEQIVLQFEARQAILFHAGLELSESHIAYKAVVQAHAHTIEKRAESLRSALGLSLLDLLLVENDAVH